VRIEPPFCQRCGFPFPALENHGATFTCSQCEDRAWHFRWARAAYRTEGEVHEAIIGFKYRDEYYQQGRLIQWLTEAYDRYAAGGAWHAVVPVPLYHRRLRERGFNQARELANGLRKNRKIAILDCLYRYRETPSQVGLERKARWENMTGAFRLKRRFDVTGRNLLLVDDVFTTGATTNACAHALAEAGAADLAVLTIARS
jgi:ComF family protein